MTTIHHATAKKAEKLGIMLRAIEEHDAHFPDAHLAGAVGAYWGEFNVHAFGFGDKAAQLALNEAIALQAIKKTLPEGSIVNKPTEPNLVLVYNNHTRDRVLDRNGTTPSDALAMLEGEYKWYEIACPQNGSEAFKQGFMAGDNPYEDGTEEADAWDEAWDEAADAEAAGDDEPLGGSVVRDYYRHKYAEQGHPNHCGDWLAVTLNNLVQGKTQTDLERFEAICNANGVSLDKYNRTTPGWQGRLRMTGRNLLVKKVYLAEGVLTLPAGMFPDLGDTLRAPADWMAGQRVKAPKTKAE